MFTVHCPVHGAPVLIWPSGVDAVRNTASGIEVVYHCTCGHRGVWLTGRRPREGPRRHEPTPAAASRAARP